MCAVRPSLVPYSHTDRNPDTVEYADLVTASQATTVLVAGHLQQLGHRPPVAGGCRDPEALVVEGLGSLGAAVAVGVPGVDLAAAQHEALARAVEGGDALGDLRGGLSGEERDHVELRVRRDVAQRVALHHAGQLLARAHEHRRLHAQAGGDLPLEVALHPAGGLPAREHHVPALHVGAHVAVAEPREELGGRGHAPPPAAADVDAAEKGDLAGHRWVISAPPRASAPRLDL